MSRKDQAKATSHQPKSNSQQRSSRNMTEQFNYAQLLCTPSTLSNLDRSPLPWFSDEIRMSDDPRVKWIDLSKTLPVLSQSNTSLSALVNDDSHSQGEFSQASQESEGTTVSGHYLDHIEAVQERDMKASTKRRRRSSKSKSKKKQVAPVQQVQKSKDTQMIKGESSSKPSIQSRKPASAMNSQNSTETKAKKTETSTLKSNREKTSNSSTAESKSNSAESTPKTKSKRRKRSKKPKS